MRWARHHQCGYEVSSQGDTRFSALFAKLQDGRTIEEAYQLDVKGYRAVSNKWMDGKGKPALNGKSRAELWEEYLMLWRCWISENPEMLSELRVAANGRVLTDKFASTDINQARALAFLITEAEGLDRLEGFSF